MRRESLGFVISGVNACAQVGVPGPGTGQKTAENIFRACMYSGNNYRPCIVLKTRKIGGTMPALWKVYVITRKSTDFALFEIRQTKFVLLEIRQNPARKLKSNKTLYFALEMQTKFVSLVR